MGGRGAGGVSRYGGGGGIGAGDILEETSLISAREGNESMVDEVLGVFRDVNEEYGYVIEDINLAKLTPGSTAIAYYDSMNKNIAINEAYFDQKTMNTAYDKCVKQGFHPGRANKTGAEAVASHELGHGLTAAAGKKMGGLDIDRAADRIVKEARKQTGDRGVVIMASKISRYATQNNKEAIAEAFADVYCNGKKAKKQSTAIVNVLNSYLK